jgi:hypothetical protein
MRRCGRLEKSGPKYFAQIMDLLGSKDGREVAVALDELREQGVLSRLDTGGSSIRRTTARYPTCPSASATVG